MCISFSYRFMSDETLLKIAQNCPAMLPLHLIARAWLLGEIAVRNSMLDRALKARCKSEYDKKAVRFVLVMEKRASIEALSDLGAFDMTKCH